MEILSQIHCCWSWFPWKDQSGGEFGLWIDGWEKLGCKGVGLPAGSEVLQETRFAENTSRWIDLMQFMNSFFFPPSFVTLHSTCVAVIICFCKVFFLPCPCPLLMADHTENRCDAGFSGWLWTDGRTQWMGEQRSGRTYISTDTSLVCVCSWNPFSLKLLENRLRGA